MKNRLIILFAFISISLNATNYYVKNGGNNVLTGLSDAQAWETISKVNLHSFSAGDSILFKRGDTFTGTLTPPSAGSVGSYIVFGAYGTGAKPIITPNTQVSPTWTYTGSNGIYYTGQLSPLAVGFNPGNILINGETKICKINDYWETHTPADGYFSNYTAAQLLALSSSYQITTTYLHMLVYFWDAFPALYYWDASASRTYLRFRGGEDPNDSTFYIAAENSICAYINAKRYIKIQNIHFIGGEYGVYVNSVSYTGSDNTIIENCYIESPNIKVYSYLSNGTIVRNDTLITNYLGSYQPGAWQAGTTYTDGVQELIYDFGKYRVGTSDSGYENQGVDVSGNNNTVHDNVLIYCSNGIGLGTGSTNEAYNNNVTGTSSIAIHFSRGTMDCSAHDNYLSNCNIAFRFQYVDDPSYSTRVNYVYRNRVYNPNAGEFMYLHYGSYGASVTEIYFYHNSVIARLGFDISNKASDFADPTGLYVINNILSIETYNSLGFDAIDCQQLNLFVWYHNWVGGTYYGPSYYGLPGNISLWADDASNLQHVGTTFWTHATDPPTFAIEGTEVLDEGVDVSQAFVLGGVNYSALPGFDVGYEYGTAPDIGYYEYEGDPDPVEPIVATTGIPTSITTISALGSGAVTYAGGGTVSDRGLCWGTSVNPTTAGSHVHSGSGLGSFTGLITGLSSNTTYHVRAFGINETGTSYGADVEFTTLEWVIGKSGSVIVTSGDYIIKIK